jgi:hypothetical protein
VNLVLSNPAGGYLGAQSTAVLTILEEAYDAWRFAHFGPTATNAAIAGDLADPDGDGVLNLLEYAQSTDPNSPGSAGSPTGRIVANQFQLQFHRNTTATDLTFVIQAANTLGGSWTDLMTYIPTTGWVTNTPGATVSETPAVGSPPDQYVPVTVTDAIGTAGASSRFFRLAVHF